MGERIHHTPDRLIKPGTLFTVSYLGNDGSDRKITTQFLGYDRNDDGRISIVHIPKFQEYPLMFPLNNVDSVVIKGPDGEPSLFSANVIQPAGLPIVEDDWSPIEVTKDDESAAVFVLCMRTRVTENGDLDYSERLVPAEDFLNLNSPIVAAKSV